MEHKPCESSIERVGLPTGTTQKCEARSAESGVVQKDRSTITRKQQQVVWVRVPRRASRDLEALMSKRAAEEQEQQTHKRLDVWIRVPGRCSARGRVNKRSRNARSASSRG